MPEVLILTAVSMEARALNRLGISATVIGIGASRLAGVAVLPGTTTVVMAGVGGAVDPALQVGDVVVDGRSIEGMKGGVIHTTERVVSTVEEKAMIFAATGATAVDMEQAIVKRWADERGLAVVGVRAISDSAGDVIDPAVVRFVTDTGRPRPAVIAAALLRRPALIPQLTRLNRDTKLALAALGPAVRAVVGAIARN